MQTLEQMIESQVSNLNFLAELARAARDEAQVLSGTGVRPRINKKNAAFHAQALDTYNVQVRALESILRRYRKQSTENT